MIEIFNSILKLLRYRRIHIDGNVFRLHCTLTVIIVMCFCIVISTKQLVGEPIECHQSKVALITPKLLNSFCYIESTYTIRNAFGLKVGKEAAHPGIIPSSDKSEYVYHSYYQWVWFILLFEAICFYFPRWLWKTWESDKMASLVSDLNFFTKQDVKDEKKQLIVHYLVRTRGSNDWYAIKYFICEFLALLNVFLQMLLMNQFLGGEFLTYGSDIIRYFFDDPLVRINPMIKLFPRLSKCEFSLYGQSGNLETLDTLCILTINVYNEKMFLFLWFWYTLLAIMIAIVVLFRLVLISCPIVRYYVCRWRFELSTHREDHRGGHRGGRDCELTKLIVHKLRIGDWFILHMLGQNIEPIIFGDILEDLVQNYKKLAQNKYSTENNENLNENNEVSYL